MYHIKTNNDLKQEQSIVSHNNTRNLIKQIYFYEVQLKGRQGKAVVFYSIFA